MSGTLRIDVCEDLNIKMNYCNWSSHEVDNIIVFGIGGINDGNKKVVKDGIENPNSTMGTARAKLMTTSNSDDMQ